MNSAGMKGKEDVYVKNGAGFKKADLNDMRMGTEFFGMMQHPRFGETWVSLPSRMPLFTKKRDGKLGDATEKEAEQGKAVIYMHDPFMPSLKPVKPKEFAENRWRYSVKMNGEQSTIGRDEVVDTGIEVTQTMAR